MTDYDDHSDLSALLERFDVLVADGAPKIGVGIERFERRLNKGDGWSSTGFWVVRTDRTSTDFSYVKAVDGNPKSQSQEFYDACHNAVSRDLLHLKQRQFDHFSNADGEIECDITGQLVVYADANLSHATPSFGTIVNDYRKAKGWELAFPTGRSPIPRMHSYRRISPMMHWPASSKAITTRSLCCELWPKRSLQEAQPCRCR